MSRPKVLLIATRYPSDEAPAVNPFIREHAKAIAAHVDVAVLCHDGAPTGNERVAVTDTVHEGLRTLRIRYRPPRVPGAPHLAYRTALRRALRLLSEEGFAPDLVHAHFYPVGFYAVRLA